MFRLLRYFSIASLFAFLIVTVLLGALYRRTAVEGLIAQEESKNVAVTQAFVNSLRPQLIAYLATTQGLTIDELQRHPALAAFHRDVESKVAGLPVAKIKIYNAAGITIFSTDVEQIGEDGHANDGFVVARGGGVVSELNHRDTFNSFDGVMEDQDVLSTYFPVRLSKSSGATNSEAIEGVFELYSNITPMLLRVNSTQRTVVLGVALILAILYVMLFLVVRHADRIIRRQHAERLQAEEASRQQQQVLTALRERERLARELHDSVAQVLGYLNTQAQAVALRWTQGQTTEARQLLDRLVEVVQHAQGDVRAQIRALQSGATYALDFPSALENYLQQFRRECDIPVELVNLDQWREGRAAQADQPLDQEVENQLLGIVQEALTNMRKHAQATHGSVVLDRRDELTVVTIRDDGKGFACDAMPDQKWHFGLQMMHDRTQEIGGILEVQSAPGQGTQVTVKVPLHQARAA